jgi:hypothetical protein
MTEKICTKCGIEKPINDFTGKSPVCRACVKIYNKNYRDKNKDQINDRERIKYALIKNGEILEDPRLIGLYHINKFVKEEHGGKCISTKYLNSKTNLLFECKYNHQWTATWDNISKGKWCPECSSYSGERITRLFFETIFDKKFPKCRPIWLVGTLGYKMELDGYCAELGIAFEHHGMHHYKINEFSNTPEKLEKRQLDDELKEKLCKENGVKLIIVPQVPDITKITELKQFITDQCQILNILIKKNLEKLVVNYELEPISFEYLKKYQAIAKAKSGKCLSTMYINSDSKLTFECKEGHIWDAIPDNVSSKNSWCRICANSRMSTIMKGKKNANINNDDNF